MPTMTWTCTSCGETVTRYRSPDAPEPRFCGPCYRQRYARGAEPHNWTRYPFTDAMYAAMQQASREGYGALKRLHERDPRFAAIPYGTFKYRCQQLLGRNFRAKEPNWAAEEDAVLLAHTHRQLALTSWQRLLKRHGFARTKGAIRERLWKLGESSRQGQWTLNQVAEGLGLDRHVITRWVEKGWLKVRATTDGPARPVRYVTTTALRACLLAHPHAVAVGKVDIVWLLGLFDEPLAIDLNRKDPDSAPRDEWLLGYAVPDRGVAD